MLIKQLGELGFLGMLVPEERGGLGPTTLPISLHSRKSRRRRIGGRYHVGAQLMPRR
jgi:alkylation response protein AidB-like acyl-CoA dehydrogenase